MNQAQATRLLQAGKDMRKAQNTYFKNKSYSNLRIAKDAERNFDKLLQECSQSGEQQMQLLPKQEQEK